MTHDHLVALAVDVNVFVRKTTCGTKLCPRTKENLQKSCNLQTIRKSLLVQLPLPLPLI